MAIIGYEVLGKNEYGIGDAVCKYVKSIIGFRVEWTFEIKDALNFDRVDYRFSVIDFIRDNAIVSDMSRLITG